MENQQENQQRLSAEIFSLLSEKCSGYSLDDIDDRVCVANTIAEWLVGDKTHDMTIEMLLPKAKYRAGLTVFDEQNNRPIIGLEFERSRWMTDGDWLAQQNFFWTKVGTAIRDNPGVIAALRTAGINVTIPDTEGGQPAL